MKFFVASQPDSLREVLAGYRGTATVEAEYGDTVVEGSVLTMAHHGARAGNPCPCSYENNCADGVEAVGLSHVDLDSMGGCLAILGRKPEVPSFWALAKFVDLNGPHKLGTSGASEEDIRSLYAYWTYAQANRLSPPRDGSAVEITAEVIKTAEILERILIHRDEELLTRGEELEAATAKLNAESFLEEEGGVLIRVAPVFVNHLYDTPDDVVGQAVVGFSTKTGGITVSFADAPKGASAKDIVQSLWGAEAGGHPGIAGSPRGTRMSLADLLAAANKVRELLRA